MMVIAIGLSSYNIALFHLVNHAFYKGLLFLGAGAVIHAVADNQDFRKYGGLISFLPLTYSVILIASLSLVAFPFMTGFYSKDFILESAFGQYYFSSIAVYVIAVIGAIFTTLYSVKVLYLTFLTNPNGSMVYYKHAHEGDIFLSLPLVILAVFSIFFGYITKDIFIGLGSNFFVDNSIFIHPIHEIMLDTEFAVPAIFKLLPLIFTISFSILAILLSEFLPESLISFKFSNIGYNIFGFFNQRFLVEMFYNKYITNLVLNLGGQTTKVLDKGSIELLGPWGLEVGLIKFSKNIASLSTGVVTSYALYILIGFIMYISIGYFAITGDLFIILFFGFISTFITYNNNNVSKLSTLKSGFGYFSMFEYIGKFQKIVYFFILLYLVIKNLTYLLDFFGIEPVQFASNDENWRDSFQDRKINVQNKMVEYQKNQIKDINHQLATFGDQNNLTQEQLEQKESLEKEKDEIQKAMNKEVKEKIGLTKNKSSYDTSNISGSKRLGGDLSAGPSHKK